MRGVCVARLAKLPSYKLSRIKVRHLTSPEQFGGINVVHVSLPPRYTHAPIVHRKTAEWLMVLKGSGQGIVGGKRMSFRPGSIVYMPPGVPHQMGTGAQAMEVIALFAPPLDGRLPDADIHPAEAR